MHKPSNSSLRKGITFVGSVAFLIGAFSVSIAVAALTFGNSSITGDSSFNSIVGATSTTWDVGSGNTLALQTTNNGAITLGSGLLSLGGIVSSSKNILFASGMGIDSWAATPLLIGNSTSTGITIGRSGQTVSFPGSVSSTVIDYNGTIAIGNTAATTVTIGRGGQIAAFPGALAIGTSTAVSSALLTIATSSNILTVLANGNVGIGTTGPGTKLEVAGVVSSTALYVTSSTFSGTARIGSSESGASGVVLRVRGLNSGTLGSNVAAAIYDTQGAGALTQLGIGYNDGSQANFPVIIGAAVETNVANESEGFFVATRSLTTDSVPIERFRVAGTGNVGIGTAAPSSTLHVAGASSTITIGTASLPGCLEMGSTSGTAKIVYVTFDANAAMTATTTKPNACQ